ncbi:MAG: acyl-CoA dehydrogenase family protein [Coriobacteriales bacterium]|jgi:cyclohexanecarboxyl-CoA dehydrogenase
MDFSFNEEQLLFQKNVREFAQTNFAAKYTKRSQQEGYDLEVFEKMAEFGILGMNLPEEYGGQGEIDYVTMGIAIEEVAKADFNAAFCCLQGGIIGHAISNFASQEIKDKWLPGMCNGTLAVGLSLTEPSCGSDAAAIKTTAVRDGDYYILNGEKTSSSFMKANAHIIFAKTDPEAGARGVSAFLVPLDDGQEGLTKSIFSDIGCKPISRGAITLKDYRVPAKNMIGIEGGGFYTVMNEFDFSRVGIALMEIGAAQAALDDAMEYAKQRTTFGKPLCSYEGISFQIAEDQTYLDAARLLCYKALWLRDNDEPHTKEAAMCKWWCPQLAFEVIQHSILIHGHLGYTDEFPEAQRLVDTLGLQLGDGAPHIQKMIVARELMGRESLPYRRPKKNKDK